MSGGSYDYLYNKVDDAADRLCDQKDPRRRAFGKHLKLVAEALHDIEWVDSGDYGRDDDTKAIDAVLGNNARAVILEEVILRAKAELKQLQVFIDKAEEGKA